MKIAYMTETYHPDINGIVSYIDSSVHYLLEQGHQVLICAPAMCPKEGLEGSEHMKGFAIARFPAVSLDEFIDLQNKRITVPFYGNVTSKVKRTLDEFRPDVVHMQTELWLSFAGWHWARANNIPTVMTAHTQMLTQWDHHIPWMPLWLLKPTLTFLFKPLYEGVDFLIAPTTGMRRYLTEYHGIHRSLEAYIIGIDPRAFTSVDPAFERENSVYFTKHPRIKTRRRLLFAGRITIEKNIDFLFESLKEMLKLRRDVELMLAGHSRLIRFYQLKADEMGISGNVTFLGPVPHSQMSKIYAITDVFTFASKSETQSLATTEAIYFDVPAVVVSAFGSDTILAGNKGGYLVYEDIVVFARQVNLLLSDPCLYAQKRQETFELQDELSFSNTMNNLINIYETLIGRARLSVRNLVCHNLVSFISYGTKISC